MSDWGAVHTTAKAALAVLDQESGEQLDKQVYFGELRKTAVEQGEVPFERLATMVRRILRSLIDKGLFDHPAERRTTDYVANGETALAAAEAGIVLLKNDGVLPLSPNLRKIAVIGAHADKGVLSGGGSSQVIPVGGAGHEIAVTMGPPPFSRITYHPSAPLAIRERGNAAVIRRGDRPAKAAQVAPEADVAIVFADQWATEAEASRHFPCRTGRTPDRGGLRGNRRPWWCWRPGRRSWCPGWARRRRCWGLYPGSRGERSPTCSMARPALDPAPISFPASTGERATADPG